MATAIGDLVARLRMDTTGFNRGAKGATRSMGVLGGAAKSLATSLVGAGGVAYAFIRGGRAANEFAGAMNRSLAIMTGVNAAIRKDMEHTAHTIAATTKYSANQAADAYFFLASAGMSAKQSIAALPAVAAFATAGNFDLALATDLSTDAQSALGLKARDVAKNLRGLVRVTDVLVTANTVANASVQQFSEAITNKAGAAMRMYGIQIEEGAAVLAAFADQGLKGTDAGTKFAIVLRDLTTKAIQNKGAFEDLGVAVFEGGEVRRLADIIGDLENALGGFGDEAKKAALLQVGFTDKSVGAIQMLLGYSDAIRNWEEQMKQAGGTTKDVADKMLTPFDKAWNKIAASMKKATVEVFTPILDQLGKMSDGFVTLNDEAAKTPTLFEKIGKAIAFELQGFSDLIALAALPAQLAADAVMGTDSNTDILGVPELVGGIDAKTHAQRRKKARDVIPAATQGVPTGQWEARQQAKADKAAELQAFYNRLPQKLSGETTTLAGAPSWITQMIDGITTGAGIAANKGLIGQATVPGVSKGPRLAAAQERGSAEAYSTIVNAGKRGEKTAREQLKVQKELLSVNRQILVVGKQNETMSIPI